MAQDYFIKKDQREYEFLLLDATQRYQNFLCDYKNLKERIPQYHIAAYLGISPVSLSRLIAKM
jgi:CRP-like cAMP-binding protein